MGGDTVCLVNTRIASSKHQLMTVINNKKSLSGYDDKRYLCQDKITTLPYGHEQLRDEMFAKQIIATQIGVQVIRVRTKSWQSLPWDKDHHLLIILHNQSCKGFGLPLNWISTNDHTAMMNLKGT